MPRLRFAPGFPPVPDLPGHPAPGLRWSWVRRPQRPRESGDGGGHGNSLGATVDRSPSESLSPTRPPTPTTLLHSAADVTPEWLTAALRGSGVLDPDAAVAGFEMSQIGTGQMADTTRFSLSLDPPQPPMARPPAVASTSPTTDSASPRSVVGKFASADDQSRGTGLALRAYEIEVRFYREVARRVATRVPPRTQPRSSRRRDGSRSCSRTSWAASRATR